jgi:hypothetical protein
MTSGFDSQLINALQFTLRIIALGLSHSTFHSSGYRFVVHWLGIFAFALGRFVRLVEVFHLYYQC